MTTGPATNISLAKALQAAIKEYVEADVAQSANHCLRCALARAHAHMEATQETTATLLEFSSHSHLVPKASPSPEPGQE